MYYITISNGLLAGDHHDRMGAAVWLYMWLIDKVTKIDEDGTGWVLGGKPIQVAEVAHMSRRSVQRYFATLRKEGYITTKRTMRGMIVGVVKAKKKFGRRDAPESAHGKPSDAPSMAHLDTPEVAHLGQKVAHHTTKSGASNKTLQNTDRVLDSAGGPPAAEGTACRTTWQELHHGGIVRVIDAFKPVNPAFGKWYGNTTQRAAISRMIGSHGLDRMLRVIALLPKTNHRPYLPAVTTPIQLEDKWAALAAGLVREREKLQTKGKKIIA